MRTAIITACAIGFGVSAAFAQTIARKDPAVYAGTERTLRVEVRPPGLRLGLRRPREFALSPLSASEAARMAGPDIRLKAGVHREFPAEALSLGSWETTAEGKRIWRMALRSP